MVIRMFEYAFHKAKERKEVSNHVETIIFPKQRVIYVEENNNIPDILRVNIIIPDQHDFIYEVKVIKYWELTDYEIIQKKLYPLLPLQLFNLRKSLKSAKDSGNINRIKILANMMRDIARRISYEAKDLVDKEEIQVEDFHKMLLAISNLSEYLNENYIGEKYIEEEVNKMTKTLYDPEVEKRGIEKGIEKGITIGKIEYAKKLLELGVDIETVAKGMDLPIDKAKKLLM